jgi:predicted dehydrogenase
MQGTASGGSPVSWDFQRRPRSLVQDKSWLLPVHEEASPMITGRLKNVWESAERGRIMVQCPTFFGQTRCLGEASTEGILVLRERTSSMSKSDLSRRQFLNRSVAIAGAGFAVGGTRSSGRVVGSNDTIRVAVAGLNDRGGSHVDEYVKMPGVTITYLVDPDTRTFDKRIHQIESHGGRAPSTVQDIRRVLEDKNVDVVSIATPNHWHALMTIWAAQAGKDVYVEKPCSHNIHEGRVAVLAARRYQRIVQHGTQSRSSQEWALAAAAVQSGKLGKLLVSRALCYKPRGSIGIKPSGTPPAEVDFNIWLGPAPQQAYHANLVHYNWHWFWDFGNGDIGNQGVHQMDIARWLIPGADGQSATYPKTVLSLGGRFGYRDQGQTANTQISVMDFGDAQLIFEVRGLKTGGYHGEKVGNIAHLEGATIIGGKFYRKGSNQGEPLSALGIKVEPRHGSGKGHFGNFIAAVRSRKSDDLNAEILQGHYSSALCHLANISYRLGTEVPFNKPAMAFGDNKEAAETLARMEEHLKDNGVALDGLDYRLGRKLTFDAATESFEGDSEANRLLTRPYRAPFVVPERVA